MEKRYMISDAAKLVDVEAHVLRYWEDELDVQSPRNEMGHRYYTDNIITLFREVKELKEQGFLNPDVVWKLWEDYIERDIWRVQIWYILMFQEQFASR